MAPRQRLPFWLTHLLFVGLLGENMRIRNTLRNRGIINHALVFGNLFIYFSTSYRFFLALFVFWKAICIGFAPWHLRCHEIRLGKGAMMSCLVPPMPGPHSPTPERQRIDRPDRYRFVRAVAPEE